MANASGVTLVCATPGTSLGRSIDKVVAALGEQNVVCADVESEVLNLLRGDRRFGVPANIEPNMRRVVKLPRRELRHQWKNGCTNAIHSLTEASSAQPNAAKILSLHLSWYSPDTQEFFSPVDTQVLSTSTPSQIVVLIDDIYDMYLRMRQEKEDIYHPTRVESRVEPQIRKLKQPYGQLSPSEAAMLDAQVQLETRSLILSHLLSWRRSETVLAEMIASNLGIPLTVLGVKHSVRSMANLVTLGPRCERIYISHRITDPRRTNRGSMELPTYLGEWGEIVDEVNSIHHTFADAGLLLINPTAIDELRFGQVHGRLSREPWLSRRWSLPTAQVAGDDILWSQPTVELMNSEDGNHTDVLVVDGLDPLDEVHGCVVRALENQIFLEIAFRDHQIVEHTPHLLVFRPFYTTEALEADWTGGVRPELNHWIRSAQHGNEFRRALFVHTRRDIKNRLLWLRDGAGQRFELAFMLSFRAHLRNWLEEEACPAELAQRFLLGGIAAPETHHLAMDQDDWFSDRWVDVLEAVRSACATSLHSLFTRLPRAHLDPRNGLPLDGYDVGLVGVESGSAMTAGPSPTLDAVMAFFRGEVLGSSLAVDFWRIHDEEFRGVFGASPEQVAFERAGLLAPPGAGA